MASASILLIEDDMALLEMMAIALSDEGYVVATALSLTDALTYLAPVDFPPFNLIITDSFARSPAEVFVWPEQLRAQATPPVILCSAYTEKEMQGWAERGFAGILTKPFDLDELITRVATVLQE